jgi:hypothetical protein
MGRFSTDKWIAILIDSVKYGRVRAKKQGMEIEGKLDDFEGLV